MTIQKQYDAAKDYLSKMLGKHQTLSDEQLDQVRERAREMIESRMQTIDKPLEPNSTQKTYYRIYAKGISEIDSEKYFIEMFKPQKEEKTRGKSIVCLANSDNTINIFDRDFEIGISAENDEQFIDAMTMALKVANDKGWNVGDMIIEHVNNKYSDHIHAIVAEFMQHQPQILPDHRISQIEDMLPLQVLRAAEEHFNLKKDRFECDDDNNLIIDKKTGQSMTCHQFLTQHAGVSYNEAYMFLDAVLDGQKYGVDYKVVVEQGVENEVLGEPKYPELENVNIAQLYNQLAQTDKFASRINGDAELNNNNTITIDDINYSPVELFILATGATESTAIRSINNRVDAIRSQPTELNIIITEQPTAQQIPEITRQTIMRELFSAAKSGDKTTTKDICNAINEVTGRDVKIENGIVHVGDEKIKIKDLEISDDFARNTCRDYHSLKGEQLNNLQFA